MVTRENRRDSGEWKKSPVQHYATWKAGSEGGYFEIEKYNTELKVKEKTTLTFTDFYFIGSSNRLIGFDKNRMRTVQSTLIDFSKPEQIVNIKVKGKDGEKIFSGVYADVKGWKEKFTNKDGKEILDSYVVLYAVHNGELYDLGLKGSALGSWIDFYNTQKYKKEFFDNKITFTIKTDKNGFVTYKYPVFKIGELVKEDLVHAERLGKELSDYFTQFDRLPSANSLEDQEDEEFVESNDKQSGDVAEEGAEAPVAKAKSDDIDDLPF